MQIDRKGADYELMHGSDIVAAISRIGKAVVYQEQFMPYDLNL